MYRRGCYVEGGVNMNAIKSYISWLKDNLTEEEVAPGIIAVTTPFLDRHNDYTQIYIQEKQDGEYRLTDDAYIISDLRTCGIDPYSKKRKKLILDSARKRGVEVDLDTDELWLTAVKEDLGEAQHYLLQTMLDVNDLFCLSSQQVKSIFLEDVQSFFDTNELYYSKNINIRGRSGYMQSFDFTMQRNSKHPERFIKVMNRANRSNAERLIFSWEDIRTERDEGSQLLIVMNDEESKRPAHQIGKMLREYNITPVYWSERGDCIPLFS